MTVAALYVERGGVYYEPGLDVDPWPEDRDARLYAGPWPVVAHPPCARWSSLAALVEARYGERFKRGEDGGTFAAALKAVIRWGGVLEHPAQTRAWRAFDLTPPQGHGWARELHGPGWVCEVSQAAYGHRAPKATWLYYVGDVPPALLRWAQPPCSVTVSPAHGGAGRKVRNGVEVMGHKERLHTPPAFRDALLSLARNARAPEAAR